MYVDISGFTGKPVKGGSGPVVQEEMSFKDIICLDLWRPFCLAEQTIYEILVDGVKWKDSEKLF